LHSDGSTPSTGPGVHLHKRKLPDGTFAYYAYERKRWGTYEKKRRREPPPVPEVVFVPDRPDRSQESIAALLRAYQQSRHWKSLAEKTRRHYAYYMRWLRPFEKWPIAGFTRADIIQVRDRIADEGRVGSALAFVTMIYAVFRFAEDEGWVKQSPAYRLILSGGKGKRNLLKLGSHEPWTVAEYDLAMRYVPEPVRRVLVVLRYTAQRLGDCLRMTWADVNDLLSTVALVQEKTDKKLVLPIHPVLAAELQVWRKDLAVSRYVPADGTVVPLRPKPLDMNQPLLVNSRGEAWNTNKFGETLERSLYAIPTFPRKKSTRRGKRADGTYSKGRDREIAARSAHGLRYLACIMLADAECSLKEIMAVSGHRTVKMVMKYIEETDQKKLARSAFAKLIANEPLPPTTRNDRGSR
jgi:integrase